MPSTLSLALLFLSCLALLVLLAHAADIAYCSSQNTGVSIESSIYQSNGRCVGNCTHYDYAFAVLSDEDCYCSNYAPSSIADSDKCQNYCPGYPVEICAGDGYYAYIEIGSPSGTRGASSATASSSTALPATSSSRSSSDDDDDATLASVVVVTSTSVASKSDSNGQTKTSLVVVTVSASDDSDKTSIVHITSTVSGEKSSVKVITSVVTNSFHTSLVNSTSAVVSTVASTTPALSSPSSAASSSASSSAAIGAAVTASVSASAENTPTSNKTSFWDSPGKVGGTFASVGIVVLILAALLIFIYIRRRYNANNQLVSASQSGVLPGTGDSANGSTLMNSPAAEKNSRRFISDADTIIPNLFGGDVDQRLDPGQMFYNNLGVDAESKKSISDEYDYSRKFLRVANPDVGLRSFISKNSVRDSMTKEEQ